VERLNRINPKGIWLVMAVLLVWVTVKPFSTPIAVSPDTRAFYDTIAKLPPGGIVLFGATVSTGEVASLGPMVTAAARQCFERGLRIAIFSTAWDQGPTLVGGLVQQVANQMGKRYGVDWINIGFKAGGVATLQLAEEDLIKAAKGVDANGKDLAGFPIMKDLPRLDHDHVAAVFALSIGSPGAPDYWLPYLTQKINVPLLVGPIDSYVPNYKPFVASGQFAAMLDGSRGAAEYEALLHYSGGATQAADGQTMAALIALVLVVLGNLGYFAARRPGVSAR
jgi:hypothetical protein